MYQRHKAEDGLVHNIHDYIVSNTRFCILHMNGLRDLTKTTEYMYNKS